MLLALSYIRGAKNHFIEIKEIKPNGGFFKHLSQELARVAWTFDKHSAFHNNKEYFLRYINDLCLF